MSEARLGPTQGEFTPTQVQQYQAARDVLATRIRGLLLAADSTTDPGERRQLDETVLDLSRQRGALQVGSDEVVRLIKDGVAAG